MKYLKSLLALLFCLGLIFLLNGSRTIGETTLPPLGRLLSPYTGFVQSAETKSDLTDKTTTLSGIDGPIQVIFDNNLVPHIYAQSNEDAFYAQGYIQASHRLWQIDMTTRAAAGRLSEVLGESMLEYDKLQRRKGMVAGAQRNLEILERDPVSNKILEQFVNGVNSYIQTLSPRDYPIEYKLMDFKPEAYSKLKIALYFKNMEQTLNSREEDLESTNALAWLGEESYHQLFPKVHPDFSPVIPKSVQFDFGSQVDSSLNQKHLGFIPHRPFEKPYEGVGSNNWAIHPSKSKSGNVILCNDPHLLLTLPSIWYEVHIHTPELNVYGVALPGVPGITIGFNEQVAWGMTNVGQDVADWYQVQWVDDAKTKYVLDDQELNVEYSFEQFKLKNGSTVYDTIKWTYWGPIVHQNEAHPYLDLAYKWLPHQVPGNNQVQTFLNLARAKNYRDYENALSYFGSPAQNVVFGSKEGDVALRVTGQFPIRSSEQGQFVQDGSTKANDWKGFIPFDHGAKVLNPARGFVASANQQSTDLTYPYPYHGGFDDYRGRLLNRKLTESSDITVQDMMELQHLSYSLKAEESMPVLLQNLNQDFDSEAQAIIRILRSWDYTFEASAQAPIYFEIWSNEFYKMVWDEFRQKNNELVLRYPEYWYTIEMAKNNPDHDFFDIDSTNVPETASDIINASFNIMVKRVSEIDTKDWSTFSDLDINHLARIGPFNAENIIASGHNSALNATYGPRQHGPSWRMIVELGDQIEAYGIFPGGQSGNPSSQYYQNNITDWANGVYRNLLFLDADEWNSQDILYTHQFKKS